MWEGGKRRYLQPQDPTAGSGFGRAVAIDGDRAVVGAPAKDQAGLKSAGNAYVFVKVMGTGTWVQDAKLVASDYQAGDTFGTSVDIDGGVTVIGSKHDEVSGVKSGSAYLFNLVGAQWVEEGKLLPSLGASYDQFGTSVAVDRNVVVVGAGREDAMGKDSGAAYVFEVLGVACSASSSSTSCVVGSCVDGVCCESACGGGAQDDCQGCSKQVGAKENGSCGPLTAGTTCRIPAQACDVAESCDGTSPTCPVDEVMNDGVACPGGTCQGGVCVLDVDAGETDGPGADGDGPIPRKDLQGDDDGPRGDGARGADGAAGADGATGADGSTAGCSCGLDAGGGGAGRQPAPWPPLFAAALLLRRRSRGAPSRGARARGVRGRGGRGAGAPCGHRAMDGPRSRSST